MLYLGGSVLFSVSPLALQESFLACEVVPFFLRYSLSLLSLITMDIHVLPRISVSLTKSCPRSTRV